MEKVVRNNIMNTSGLIAGLCIGVPALVAVLFMLYMWFFNEKKQKKEDAYDIDFGTRDDELFDHFRSELHKPYASKVTETYDKLTTLDDNIDDNQASHSSDSIERPKAARAPSTPSKTTRLHDAKTPISYEVTLKTPLDGRSHVDSAHAKTPLSYDFYDSFIPVMASSTSVDNRPHYETASEEHATDAASTSRLSFSVPSGNHQEKSLDNLAKQLHGPQLFEKLPTRVPTVQIKQRPAVPSTSYNNLSTDLILSQEAGGINEHFTYEANALLQDNKPHAYTAFVSGSPKSDESPFRE